MKTVADVLTDEGKWTKWRLRLGSRYCIRGAVIVKHGLEYELTGNYYGNEIAARHPEVKVDFERLAEAARALFPERVEVIETPSTPAEVQVNNHPATTFDDILRVCKVAGV